MPVLDASFLIAVRRGEAKAMALAKRLSQGRKPHWIPAVVWMEFLTWSMPAAMQEAADLLGEAGAFIALEREIAERGARLQNALLRQGRRMSWNDVQVAATALQLGEPVVTLDRDFSGILGLEVIRP